MHTSLKRSGPLGFTVAIVTWWCWPSVAGHDPLAQLSNASPLPRVTRMDLAPQITDRSDRDPFTAGVKPRSPWPSAALAAGASESPSPPPLDLTDILSELNLDATYVRGDAQLALISGGVYRPGDAIAPSAAIPQAGVVERVRAAHVLLAYEGRRYQLSYSGVQLVRDNLVAPATGSSHSGLWQPLLQKLPTWLKSQ